MTNPPAIAMRSFGASLPMALLRAREAAMRRFRPLLAAHGLTEQQWRTLRALSAAPEALEVGAIADQTFLLSPSVSRILANLDTRGLVNRSQHPSDQRRSLISLSAAGSALVAQVAPESERQYEAIETAFGAARLDRLLAELADLEAHLDDDTHSTSSADTGATPS